MTSEPKPTVVIFFNDWAVFPNGVNSGGGESATMALAKQIAAQGYRVIACAHLPYGECSHDGIDFWNFGAGYSIDSIEKRLREIGPYYCLCATLAHPLLLLRNHQHCLARIIINHAPSPHASGLEPRTVLEFTDAMACVSMSQKRLVESVCGEELEKLVVVKNGFDPEVFPYAGPEQRDWNQLIFIGRAEPAKGIHLLIQVFGELKAAFPELKLAVYGDDQRWAELAEKKAELMQRFPGLVFHGKVPQKTLSERLRRAGVLVFPSVSFESAGLAVVDAQASGCPVVAFDSGGVADYLDPTLGELIADRSVEALRESLARLLGDRLRLERMSRRAEKYGRERTWSVVARDIINLAESIVARRVVKVEEKLPESVRRIGRVKDFSPEVLLRDHDKLVYPDSFPESELARRITVESGDAWPYLIRGLRLEKLGQEQDAIAAFHAAAERSAAEDWQPFFRLAMLHLDRREIAAASKAAQTVLERSPQFPYRHQLEKVISLMPPQSHTAERR